MRCPRSARPVRYWPRSSPTTLVSTGPVSLSARPRALGRRINRRKPPHLPSPDQVREFMEAALLLRPAGSPTPLTFHTIIGLVAATGMRCSEATGPTLNDITPEGLLVRHAKNDGTGLLPLQDSAARAFDDYLDVRMKEGGANEHLFVLVNGDRVRPAYLTRVLIRLARENGARGGSAMSGDHHLRTHRAFQDAITPNSAADIPTTGITDTGQSQPARYIHLGTRHESTSRIYQNADLSTQPYHD